MIFLKKIAELEKQIEAIVALESKYKSDTIYDWKRKEIGLAVVDFNGDNSDKQSTEQLKNEKREKTRRKQAIETRYR